MIQYRYFPKSQGAPNIIRDTVEAFRKVASQIDSSVVRKDSDHVLHIVGRGLEELGFRVEKDKSGAGKIPIPVLYGLNGKAEKLFNADGYHAVEKVVVEIEAAAAVANNRFLKDLFEACVMDNVRYCVIAVRNTNLTSNRAKDFDTVVRFIETIYASQRLQLPLSGVCIVGY